MDTAKFSRRTWICGVCATGAALAAPPFATAAQADDHAQERQIGQQVFSDEQKKGDVLTFSPYYPVLRSVGAKISAAAQPHWWPMNFVIVKGDRANAFSVPGGWVYVNEALLKNAGNEAELASVVGHETGHIVLGHVMNRIRQAQTLNLAFGIMSIFVHSQGAANTFNVAQLLANYGYLNFNRQQEYQADHEGVILAGKAGYNPWAMVWFFQKLEKLYGDVGFEQYVQDHPATKDRIKRIETYFSSDPARFARWSSRTAPETGLRLARGSDARLTLSGV
ncbi:MAG: M48 family metalloprotease [Candidatus Eremiobacteraeota bacterium]|nr:M48 family metalloprotease [Candidatus Eremiobacteraeota bacterium]